VDHVVQFVNTRSTLPGLETPTTMFRKEYLLTRTSEQVLHGRRQHVA